jgi:RNA polymerase sigma factor (sigma-70 family)
MTDIEILKMLKSDIPDKGIQKLYTYFPVVKRFVLKHGGQADDAYDIFQEALLIFIDKLRNTDFQLSSSINTYLFSICKYKWKEVLIKQNRLQRYQQDFANEQAIDFADDEPKLVKAESAFQKLGERCQALLLSFYYEKASMLRIAADFGFASEKVAKNEKYKCLEKARHTYSEMMNDLA